MQRGHRHIRRCAGVDGYHGVTLTNISQELTQRKKAFTVWVIVVASRPTFAEKSRDQPHTAHASAGLGEGITMVSA